MTKPLPMQQATAFTTNKKRIESIDLLRGIVIVIMALDHIVYLRITAVRVCNR